MHKIYVVSMGPGGIDMLTWEAVQAIYKADILIGSEKFVELYPEHGIIVPEKIVSGTIELIKENTDKKVAVLVTGDAGFYSLAKSVVKQFGRDHVKIIPGVSIVQLAFARLCEPWQDAKLLSVHGRDIEAVNQISDTSFLVLCDDKNRADKVAELLFSKKDTHDIYVLEELESENEKITEIKDISDTNKLNGSSIAVVAGIRRDND